MTAATTIEPDTHLDARAAGAPQHTVCWFEIPAEDYERAIGFYETVLKTRLERFTENVPNPYAMFPTADGMGISGHIYPGKPARGAGPTVHLVVPDSLEATLERVSNAGGEVLPGIVEIPPGRFAYATDSEGNSVGFFETR